MAANFGERELQVLGEGSQFEAIVRKYMLRPISSDCYVCHMLGRSGSAHRMNPLRRDAGPHGGGAELVAEGAELRRGRRMYSGGCFVGHARHTAAGMTCGS